MNSSTQLTTLALLALAVVSIVSGILVLQANFVVALSPGWSMLCTFFGVGMVWKMVMLLHALDLTQLAPARLVTVEFDWSLRPQEVIA